MVTLLHVFTLIFTHLPIQTITIPEVVQLSSFSTLPNEIKLLLLTSFLAGNDIKASQNLKPSNPFRFV